MSMWKTVVTILIVMTALGWVLTAMHAGPWEPFQVVGLAVMAPTFCLWALARLQLGESFTVSARATQLVTRGLYSRIRNPVYVFGGLFVVGLLIYLGRPVLFLMLIIIVPLQITRVRKESRVLEATFGDEYRAYKARTWF
jgi:protein-S-isoprenylcysteine O-methyltransferase Ste14